jgi:hypothetical protein
MTATHEYFLHAADVWHLFFIRKISGKERDLQLKALQRVFFRN